MGKYKTYIKEIDLHYKLMDFLNPETQYGLDKQIKNTDGADSRDFKRGAMWGAAMFLLFASAECEKVYIEDLTEEERKESQEEQKENAILAQIYIGLKELILGIIDTEKRKAFNEILKNTMNKEKEKSAFVYHQAVCELGDKISQVFEENK